jgi:hypothetical protein
VLQFVAELGHELRVVAVALVGGFEFVQRVDQGLGDEGAAVGPEMPAGIGLLVVQHGDAFAGALRGRGGGSEVGDALASASRTALQNRRISAAFLMPLALHAGAHVNGPGPDAQHPIDHVCRIQPTRQNDRKGHAWWNQ